MLPRPRGCTAGGGCATWPSRPRLCIGVVPGRTVTVSDKGVAARVDLGEALAAKAALEDAGVQALDAVILRHAEAQEEKK